MKKSILLGLGAVAMAMAGVAAVSQPKAAETKATTLGQVIYLDVSDSSYQWWANNVGEDNEDGGEKTVIGMYTWGGTGGERQIRAHRVKGFDNNFLFEFTCNVSDYTGFIFFRGKGELNKDNVHNKTNDIDAADTAKGNVWKIYGDESYGNSNAHNDWDMDYARRAEIYGNYFNGNVGCDSSGVDAPEGWGAVASEYDALPDGAKAEVVTAVADQTSDKELPKAVATYDWAVTHNPSIAAKDKFITGRASSGAASVVSINNSFGKSAGLMAGLVSVGLVAAGTMIFVARKHKEN